MALGSGWAQTLVMTTLDEQVLDRQGLEREGDQRSDGAAIFGSVFVEIVNPSGAAVCLPGFTTRLWSVARLGDQTLEARPSAGPLRVPELLASLRAAGVTPLSVRLRPDPLPLGLPKAASAEVQAPALRRPTQSPFSSP